MEKRGGEADSFLFIADIKISTELVDDLACGFHHAEAVAVARVIGAGIGEGGHAELANAAKALHLDGVEQSKEQAIDRPLQAEGDDIMNRVADDLF